MRLFDADPIAVWSLLVAIVAVLVAIPAAIAAALALKYAKAAPTANDLARVEGNTAATSEHLEEVKANVARVVSRLKQQREIQELRLRASRVSITARGNQAGNAPYKVNLSLKDPSASLTHVELFNENGNAFGSFPCSKADNPSGLEYVAVIPITNMGEWFRGGTPVQALTRMRLKLTVWMSIDDDVEVSRDMAVIVIDTMLRSNLANPREQGYILEGSV